MQTVLFLFPALMGHLNPTIKLAKHYVTEGFSVYYGGTPELVGFTQKHGFQFHAMNSISFALGLEDILHEDKKEKWLESLVDRHTNKLYKLRKKDIEGLIKTVNPDLIFLDEFNYSDFILLYPFLEKRKLVILQTKFPMYYHPNVPPLNTYAFPNSDTEKLWKTYFRKYKWRYFLNDLKFFGKGDLSMLRQKFKEQKIHQKFQINTQKVFNPTFNNVEEWFLIPQELDFPQQQLLPWQKYVGPMVMTDRQENLEANYLNFIKKKETYPNSKLLYCSLGTVLKSHLVHRKGDIYTFFNAIIDIAFENPSLYFVIALEKSMRSTLKTTSENIIFLDYTPQIDILSKADVFLTHAGPGSVFESIIQATPMLLFPLNDKWDQNGTAARVVYHGLGKKADLADSKQSIEQAIFELLNNKSYQQKAQTLSTLLLEKYSNENYLKDFFSTELLVQ